MALTFHCEIPCATPEQHDSQIGSGERETRYKGVTVAEKGRQCRRSRDLVNQGIEIKTKETDAPAGD
jgi:hypothetical protein